MHELAHLLLTAVQWIVHVMYYACTPHLFLTALQWIVHVMYYACTPSSIPYYSAMDSARDVLPLNNSIMSHS